MSKHSVHLLYRMMVTYRLQTQLDGRQNSCAMTIASKDMLPAMTKLTALLLRISLPTAIFRLWAPLDADLRLAELTGTRLPPTPSTTFPDLTSITLAWHNAPRIESSMDPPNPTAVMTSVKMIFDFQVQSSQNGRSAVAVTHIVNDPRSPASSPARLTPPLVPGATVLHGATINLGCDFDSIPSSEEKVSDAAAA